MEIEAILVEISRDINQEYNNEEELQNAASRNVSVFFGVKYAGIFITAYLSGFLLEYISKNTSTYFYINFLEKLLFFLVFCITASFPFVLFLSSFFLTEKKAQQILSNPQEPIEKTDILEIEKLNETKNKDKSCFLFGCSKNCKKLFSFIKQEEILKPLVFLLLFNSIPAIGSPMFYYYTNYLHFSTEFIGTLNLINSVASCLAVIIYRFFLKNVAFKKIFFITSCFCIISQMLLLVLITRINLDLGIDDKVFSVCDNLFIHMMAELNLLPVLSFACRICPKNIEGTVYALIMSTLNLGSLISEQSGALLVYLLGITSNNFHNLWVFIAIENIFIVFLLPFLFCLKIEQAHQITEKYEEISEEQVKFIRQNNEEKLE